MAGFKRDVAVIIRKLDRPESGCTVSMTRRGHWKITKAGCMQVIISPNPSDLRTIRNVKADLKRYLGIEL